MKKISLVILLFACNNGARDLTIQKKVRIDSLTRYMDTVLFKSEKQATETRIVEDYDSYGAFFNKDFPEFGKFNVHNHDSVFIDSTFYYYKSQLIKLTASKKKGNKVFGSTALYFEDQKVLGSDNKLDSAFLKQLLIAADKHLKDIKIISSKLIF
jgi:hypothetical protein